jgi:hypothetical protein
MTVFEQVEWWVSKENALQEYFPEFKIDDAVAIREVINNLISTCLFTYRNLLLCFQSARRFMEWVQEGEDED